MHKLISLVIFSDFNSLLPFYLLWNALKTPKRNILKLHPNKHVSVWRPKSCLFHMKITECYKKLASRLWLVLFTLTYFYLYIDSPFLMESNCCCDYCFLSKLDHRPLFSDINYKTILVWGLSSTWCHMLPIVHNMLVKIC